MTWCLCLYSAILSHLPSPPLKSGRKLQQKRSAVCFLGYSTPFFSWEYFPAKQKGSGGLMTSRAVELCLHYRKYAKLLCLSLSVSLPLLHNSVSVDQDTGRLGSDSQGFTCKSESMIQWHWMFSHLMGMYTGEHRHISIKTMLKWRKITEMGIFDYWSMDLLASSQPRVNHTLHLRQL